MVVSHQKEVSRLLTGIFAIAKAKYHDRHETWTNLSALLAGRFSLPASSMSVQRQGDLDLLLCCIEDELSNEPTDGTASNGLDFTFHYLKMFSESWIVSCYEILRAFRQRDIERGIGADSVSVLPSFATLFADFELLRIPIAKYEIAKDKKMKEPLNFMASPPNNDATDHHAYSKDDPGRSHFMPTGMSSRGSITWLAIDHAVPHEYWIERRDLAERFLALGTTVVPAGILEAQRVAAQNEDS